MAKGKGKKTAIAKTWQSKTKTPKSKRSGIRAALHHSMPVIRLQTPVNWSAPFVGETAIRAAFLGIDASVKHPLIPMIIGSLVRTKGRAVRGWSVDRAAKSRRARRRKGEPSGDIRGA